LPFLHPQRSYPASSTVLAEDDCGANRSGGHASVTASRQCRRVLDLMIPVIQEKPRSQKRDLGHPLNESRR
jgi:hypothetical protein